MSADGEDGQEAPDRAWLAGLGTVLREWGRIGVTGFGGPPAHIALLRRLCVDREGWLDAAEFEDAIAACNLLPGPASTELAIFCAWRVRGRLGAVVGGLAFIVPGLIVILALSALFLAGTPPLWVAARAPAPAPRSPRSPCRPGGPADPQLEARLGPRAGPRLPPALGGLPAGGRGRLGHDRGLAGAGPARLRHAGADAAAGLLAASHDRARARAAVPGDAERGGAGRRWPGWRSRSARCPSAGGS